MLPTKDLMFECLILESMSALRRIAEAINDDDRSRGLISLASALVHYTVVLDVIASKVKGESTTDGIDLLIAGMKKDYHSQREQVTNELAKIETSLKQSAKSKAN